MTHGIIDAFQRVALRFPDRLALCGTRRYTYAELSAEADCIARRLLASSHDDAARPVLVLGPTDVPTAALVLGVLRAGRVVGVLDVHSPDARLREQIESVGARVLCVTPELCKRAEALGVTGLMIVAADAPLPVSAALPTPSSDPDAPATIVFTSGTTGKSKAFMQRQRRYRNDAEWVHVARDSRIERELLMRSMSFASGMSAVLRVLCAGRTGVFYDLHTRGLAELQSFIEAECIDEAVLTIELHRRWLDMLPSGAHVRLKRLTLNGKIYGRDLTRTWSVLSPDADVQMRYTSTETGRIASVLHTCYDEFAADDVVPVGRLFTGIALRIVREDGSDAPVGEIGRLLVRSDRHALGDVGEGNGTRRFDDGAPLFDTQDLASLDEQGRLRIFGRSGDVVKMNGYIAST